MARLSNGERGSDDDVDMAVLRKISHGMIGMP
jgi:hypothetical protein